MVFAPKAFRETRLVTAERVEQAFKVTDNLNNVSPEHLKEHPEVLPILRMSTCPPSVVWVRTSRADKMHQVLLLKQQQ